MDQSACLATSPQQCQPIADNHVRNETILRCRYRNLPCHDNLVSVVRRTLDNKSTGHVTRCPLGFLLTAKSGQARLDQTEQRHSEPACSDRGRGEEECLYRGNTSSLR